MRACRRCGVEKPLEMFSVANAKRGWRRHECKDCERVRHQSYVAASKEAIRAGKQSYYRANREREIARAGQWAKANPKRRREIALAYYYRMQDAAIRAYGGYHCCWCGIEEPLVLCIDHVANDGRAHRREIGSMGGHRFYKWLRDHDYPDGFQVLCMNCNHAKYRNGGVIPQSLKGRCNDHPERE